VGAEVVKHLGGAQMGLYIDPKSEGVRMARDNIDAFDRTSADTTSIRKEDGP
jgi:hypothetical protein